MSRARILIVDDEPEMLENLDRLLSGEGYRCWTLGDSRRLDAALGESSPDVVITDLRMPGVGGMDVLATALAHDPSLPVILITGYATVASALEAVQQGAFDYLAKPFTADQLSVAVSRALRYRTLVVENEGLRRRVGGATRERLLGSSPPFLRLLDKVERIASTDANVLITGESGTGKEVVARTIHELSGRSGRPFVPVDCAALPEGLLESELFGHERGAFTGAVARRTGLLVEADGGTVFLDEVAELTSTLQAKLLRVLEEREVRPVGSSKHQSVDIRMLAATNTDLEEAVAEGTFRKDLFYRLDVVHLAIPPLRARPGDIGLLVRGFLDEFARAAQKHMPEVDAEVWSALEVYDWPGNVRQLRNLVEQIVALDADGRVTLSDLPPQIRFAGREADATLAPTRRLVHLDYADAREAALREFRAEYLRELLNVHRGNVSRAARAAGVSRRTLHRWLAELGHAEHRDVDDGDGEE